MTTVFFPICRLVSPHRDAGLTPLNALWSAVDRIHSSYFTLHVRFDSASRNVFRQSGSAAVRNGTVQEQKRQPAEQKRSVALQQQQQQQQPQQPEAFHLPERLSQHVSNILLCIAR